eukprot:2003981-Pleurochrysis_carterae.AAC.1
MIGIELAAWRRGSKMKKKADRVAVITARGRPCMRAMPSEGCAGAMALSTVGSAHMSISFQQLSVHAACALAGGRMTPKGSACQSSDAEVEILSTPVVTAFISGSPGESAESLL